MEPQEIYPGRLLGTQEGTPSWAVRNQHFYGKMGFVGVRETEVDPTLGWSGVEYERSCVGRDGYSIRKRHTAKTNVGTA